MDDDADDDDDDDDETRPPRPPLPSPLARPYPPGSLRAGFTEYFSIDADACEGFLHVESWDLRRLQGPVQAKADQMLMVNYASHPWARYTPDNVWEWNSDTTKKDLDGYKLLRPYHHVSVDMRRCDDKCAEKCATSDICVKSCKRECVDPNRGKPWMIAIYNVELWMANTLEYQVMATCVSAAEGAPCPRPKGSRGGMCSGASNGACEAGTSLLFH